MSLGGETPTEEMAAELAKRKLNVLITNYLLRLDLTYPPQVAQKLGTIVPRVGTPEDVASLVSYLASPSADFITGKQHYWVVV